MYVYIYIHGGMYVCLILHLYVSFPEASPCRHYARVNDDDKFTPTKHLTPPPHHSSSRSAAAHTETETPLVHQRKG